MNNGMFIKSNNLIESSSVIAHPRYLKIMNTRSLQLRDALKFESSIHTNSLFKYY